MRMLSLFAGIGGIDLAAQWAGIETVAFCEIDPFCQKVLKKHWPDVPIFSDIRELSKEVLDREGITGIDIVAGGYPCQPYSVAGKRKGKEDDRHLWPEMLRVIRETRPTWVVGENVAGHVSLGLDDVLANMDALEYTSQAFLIPACSVGAFHKRDRVIVVSNSDGERMEGLCEEAVLGKPFLLTEQLNRTFQNAERRFDTYQSRLCRNLHGLPHGVDRVRALGNAVVPQQIYPIFAAIAAIEKAQAEAGKEG